MKKVWADGAWDEYLWWQRQDKKIVKKINDLIKDIERNGMDHGIGSPEHLKYVDAWSRHIDKKNRLVYNVDDQGYLQIISCKDHYDDK